MSDQPGRSVLADSDFGRVEMTRGGAYYVYFGNTAMCMSRDDFEGFVTTLAVAAVRSARTRQPPRLRVVASSPTDPSRQRPDR